MPHKTELSLFLLFLKYELLIGWRNFNEFLYTFLVFLSLIFLFPLTMGADKKLLPLIAPGALWIVSLFNIFIGLSRLFYIEFYEGSLEKMSLQKTSFFFFILAKLIIFWLSLFIPLLLFTPCLLFSFGLPFFLLKPLILSLLLGTPSLVLIGAITSALTLGLRQNSGLLILLTLPLFTPILLLGSSAVILAKQGLMYNGLLAWLGVLLCLSLLLAPKAIESSLRLALGNFS